MPQYPGPVGSDVQLQYPFTLINALPVLTPAPKALTRGGFTYVFGNLAGDPTQQPAFETLASFGLAALPAGGLASDRVVVPIGNALPLQAVSFELEFNGAPGAFEVDFQDADTDCDAAFQSIANAKITAVSGQNFARFELSPFVGKFVRALMKTLTNNVGWRLKVTGQ